MKKVQDGIGDAISGMLDRSKKQIGYMNRVLYPLYQLRQVKRWQTEGQSEGHKWKPLNPKYKEYKLKKFAQYDGAGAKMMVATSRLYKDVVGSSGGNGHRKIIEGNKLIVSWTTPYAIYTEDIRPVNEWDPVQDKRMYANLVRWLMKNEFGSGGT
jgi:hypothetical protein